VRETDEFRHICRSIGMHKLITRGSSGRAKKVKKQQPKHVEQFYRRAAGHLE
jgi:hypothetical protein